MKSPTRTTLLLVDDTPANLSLLIDTLQGAGHEIRVAESGERALKQIPLIQPDLVLLDVMMPGIDGFETCRRLKADLGNKETPVLFVTAVDEVVDKLRGFEAGGVDYITKPIQPREVLARVTAHLQLASLRRELAHKNTLLQEEIDLRLEAERQLHRTLDRAIVVARDDGQIVFRSLAVDQLLARYFPNAIKDRLPDQLLTWVRAGARRLPEVEPQLRARLFAEPQETGSFVLLLEDDAWQPKVHKLIALGLTPREAEVLYWLAQGKNAPDIGVILEVSNHTVRKHAQTVLEKLGVENRAAAIRLALEKIGT